MSATIIDRELEAKHRAVWALGDYASVADDLVRPLGSELVAAAGIRAGQRVLDVAAGT
nr:SAM-dependent methyltransferase [Mycobacterium sp.]